MDEQRIIVLRFLCRFLCRAMENCPIVVATWRCIWSDKKKKEKKKEEQQRGLAQAE